MFRFDFLLTGAIALILISVIGCRDSNETVSPLESNPPAASDSKTADTANNAAALTAANAELEKLQDRIHDAESKLADAKSAVVDSESRLADLQTEKESATRQAEDAEQRYQLALKKIRSARKILAEESPELPADIAESTESNQPAVSATTKNTAGLSANFFSWNVESDGSDPAWIAKQLNNEFSGYDVYTLTEVLPEAFDDYSAAIGDSFESVESQTGRNDRMQILFNRQRFELVRKMELDEINFEHRYRSPLVAHLKEKKTGLEFLVMVNHLARGRATVREIQAGQLVEWAREQTLPIIALGDYNLDFVFSENTGNDAFRVMLRDNIWKWIKPVEFVDTNWFDNPDHPDGEDDYPGSMLDFAFVAGPAKSWNATCKILVRPGDFPDNEKTSDHRPFELRISP